MGGGGEGRGVEGTGAQGEGEGEGELVGGAGGERGSRARGRTGTGLGKRKEKGKRPRPFDHHGPLSRFTNSFSNPVVWEKMFLNFYICKKVETLKVHTHYSDASTHTRSRAHKMSLIWTKNDGEIVHTKKSHTI